MQDKDYYIERLRIVAEREHRLPKKSDFTLEEVNKIKGFFGPWPYALEKAGLKESTHDERIEKNKEKRRRSREKRRNNIE